MDWYELSHLLIEKIGAKIIQNKMVQFFLLKSFKPMHIVKERA